VFCVSNGSVTPKEEGFAKQTQVMLLGRWLSDAAASRLIEIDVKMEPWLKRYSWEKIKWYSPYKKVWKSLDTPGKGYGSLCRGVRQPFLGGNTRAEGAPCVHGPPLIDDNK
jgi:hypothetical protein